MKITLNRGSDPPTTLVTDTKGVFEVYDLPSGSYRVTFDLPEGRKLDFGYVSGARKFVHELPLTVELGETDATAVFVIR